MTANGCETRLGWCLIIFVINGYHIQVLAVTTIHPLNLNVFAGENAVFECNNLDAITTYKWLWFKGQNSEVIVHESYSTKNGYEFVVSNTRQASSLTIINTTIEDDQSRYFCQFGSLSKLATLTVIDGSRLDSNYPDCEADIAAVNSRKTVTMTCGARGGNPRPSLQWYRNGVMIEHDDFTNMGDDTSYFNEITRVLTVEDEEAVFMCKAEGLAATENQTCYINIRVPLTVMITSTTTSFSTGDSLEFTCLAVTPWIIKDYIWTVNNQLVRPSNSIYNLTDHKTTLIMNNLQSGDADTKIKCEAVTASGLTGSNTITISFNDQSKIFKIVGIVVGGLVFLSLICLILFIVIRRRRLKEKASVDKPVVLVEPLNQNHPTDVIVHGVPLDSPIYANAMYFDFDTEST
ncbi:hemicentin-1-like [Anneissia japonica]|uniref:hemicentin-1-like n=1 Tax=Anneissia japonica TaxID=1529436 RepID=UPI0014256774|nr:hemicentin-1-like [Anneissia japonica]